MSINIKIGNKTFTKDGIIYISPNGNDNNNGLTEDTPVLTFNKAVSLASNNYAIKFMSGDHVFTNGSISFSKTGLLIYSDPTNTTITFNNTSSITPLINISSPNNISYLINLNILFNNNRTRFMSGDIFITLYYTKIYNCIIISKYTGESGTYYSSYDIQYTRYESLISNSIIYANYPSNRGSSESVNVSNSILSNLYSMTISGSNNIINKPTSTEIDDIIKELKSKCTDNTGIYIGDYQEWEKNVKHFIYYNLLTDKYEGILSLNTVYSTNDLNEIVTSDNRFDLYKLNTYFDKLPDTYKSIMYNKLIKA